MFTIYKYPIPIEDKFTLDLPIGARILCIQMQREEPQLWTIVDPNAAKQPRMATVTPRIGTCTSTSVCTAASGTHTAIRLVLLAAGISSCVHRPPAQPATSAEPDASPYAMGIRP